MSKKTFELCINNVSYLPFRVVKIDMNVTSNLIEKVDVKRL